MKILMFSADPNILDAGSQAAGRMVGYGKQVDTLDILVLERTSHAAHGTVSLSNNVTVYTRSGFLMRFPKGFFLAARLLKKEKYDLLVAQDIEHAKMCWLLSFRFKTPWQMQIHADIFSPHFARHRMLNGLRAALARFLIPRASCIRVVSRRIRYPMVRQWANLKVDVLPILASSAVFDIKPERFHEFEATILMVSRLTSEKNIGLAIDAMAEVVKKHPKAGLVIVGDGPERKRLELKTTNYKLQANIKFEGWQQDPVPYYRAADIYLLTSWYEGWGMSVVDAMRYGVPVVMTDVGVAGELLEDAKTGFVVKPGDKDGLIVALLRLLGDKELRGRLTEDAHKKIQELPSEEEYYKKIIQSWQQCGRPIR